jgi:hypothetical protein
MIKSAILETPFTCRSGSFCVSLTFKPHTGCYLSIRNVQSTSVIRSTMLCQDNCKMATLAWQGNDGRGSSVMPGQAIPLSHSNIFSGVIPLK